MPAQGDDGLFSELNRDPAVQRFIGSLSRSCDDFDVRVVTTCDGVAVGVVSVGPSGFSQGEYFELVCAVLPNQQGRGYAVAACREMLRAARATGAPTVVGCVDRSNDAGLRLLKRLDAKFMRQRGWPHDDKDVYSLG
jgi:ribosomal protein S18 acetylase RimI-like enzyme